ncbi:N-acetylmuramoyl-L-alanine amidase [Flammeovirgaceae bacterium 311]|nr:N-acetylmuramoyl-L-alanine amidase [Flammeovirgaceae bacterium 311]
MAIAMHQLCCMGNADYLMLHCAATPEGRDVQPQHIAQMHLGPCDILKGGKYLGTKYNGRTYHNRAVLPEAIIGGVPIHKLNGRGWQQVGYRELIDIFGKVHILVDYNDDAWIQDNEITNGAAGWNHKTIHIVYAGGVDQNLKAKDTRTAKQREAMAALVCRYILHHPNIKVIGHNQVARKDCPSFDVPAWAKSLGLDPKNIETRKFY